MTEPGTSASSLPALTRPTPQTPCRVLIWPAQSPAGQEACRALAWCKDVLPIAAHGPATLEGLEELAGRHQPHAILPCDNAVLRLLARRNPHDLPAQAIALCPTPQALERRSSPDAARTAIQAALEGLAHGFPVIPANAEIHVDCLSDREQGLVFCGPRQVVERDGILEAASLESGPFLEMARMVGQTLELHGVWSMQLFIDGHGGCQFLGITPRLTAGMALHRARGVNLPLLVIYETARLPISAKPSGAARLVRGPAQSLRLDLTFDAVYVDLDDTLVLRGMVNADLVAFLFRCLNQGKQLILVSRHDGDIQSELKRYRLTGLFHRVEHLDREQSKAEVVDVSPALFIDDSFGERRDVAEKTRARGMDCAVLDCSALEAL